MMKKISILLLIILTTQLVNAQDDDRVITTGVPFLLIAADARSAGMGRSRSCNFSRCLSQCNGILQNMLFH